MRITWNKANAAAHLAKHGVAFEAVHDADWDKALKWRDLRQNYGEPRFIALVPVKGRLHVAVYVTRRAWMRIISVRKANQRERSFYESQKP
jgi:uncharacterized DUF497 family protein